MIKKILAFVLVFLLFLPSALSEGIDLTGIVFWYPGGMIHLSDECPVLASEETPDGLVFGTVDQALGSGCAALCARCAAGGPSDVLTVPMGTYDVGEDVLPGKYTVICGDTELAVVWIYAPGSKTGKYFSIGTHMTEQKANINLQEGGRLVVEHGKVFLGPFEGLGQ